MKINTTRFGELEVDKKDIISFKIVVVLMSRGTEGWEFQMLISPTILGGKLLKYSLTKLKCILIICIICSSNCLYRVSCVLFY